MCRVTRPGWLIWLTVATSAVVLGTTTANAQSTRETPDPTEPSATAPPRPSIGLPLPSIGLPHPATGLPPVVDGARRAARPVPEPRRRRGRARGDVLVFLPMVVVAPSIPEAPAAPPVDAGDGETAAAARVRLEIEPRVVQQVFLDGSYVGTRDEGEVGTMELRTEPGTHVLEVHAPGHEVLRVPLRVGADTPLTYRATLQPVSQTAPAEPAPADEAATFYVIPGCYLGNVPPEEVALPSTCDRTRVTTVTR